ncbi:hypothetical protein HH214_15500 [Mucilaginibacter robiniae]|uniref:Uncharacterized protein n=1 Tax=Mucilaginibacter robiniae TaxID=2728022 RepID=A0A7L5E0L7_9SPHI|nr:hypothetical protein [Mucilaginibacter robiniae]QJD94363.1 hypothetical protein HH214_15500 [Mucilaginibacter robiniae]
MKPAYSPVCPFEVVTKEQRLPVRLYLPAPKLMKVGPSEKRSVTPQQAIELLEKHGCQVTKEEAEKLLDFLYFLGKLTVDQLLKDSEALNLSIQKNHSKPTKTRIKSSKHENCGFIYKSKY